MLKHIRDQRADMDRVKSRIADLTCMRAGHINIVATREVVSFFLPKQPEGIRQALELAGYLRGRTLAVAAARFLKSVNIQLTKQFG